MKKFYYKNSKIFKLLFLIMGVFLFLFIPISFLFLGREIDNTIKIKEPEFAWEIPPTQKTENSGWETIDGEEIFFADWDFKINYQKFNTWEIEDYAIYVSTDSTGNIGFDGNGNMMLWTPEYIDDKEVKKSLIFNEFYNPTLSDSEEKELFDMITNSENWDNNSPTKIEHVSSKEMSWTINILADFSLIDNNGIKLKYEMPKISEQIKTITPNGDIYIYNPTISGYDNEENKFNNLFTREGNIVNANELSMIVQPSINIYDPNPYSIYEIPPNLDITISSETEVLSTGENIESVLSYGNQYFLSPSFKMPRYFYDEDNYINNNLTSESIKISGNISWKYKSEEDIQNLFPGQTINWGAETNSSKEIKINFGGEENSETISNDTNILFDYLKFNKQTPDMVLIADWNKFDLFSIKVFTNDKYSFDSINSNQKDYEFHFVLDFIDKYGEKTHIWRYPQRFTKEILNGEEIYYSEMISSELNKKNDYTLVNTSNFSELATNDNYYIPYDGVYIKKFSILNNPNIEIKKIDKDYDMETFVMPEGHSLLLLPENISVTSFEHIFNRKMITTTITLLLIFLLIIPILIQLFIFLYKKFK